MKARRLGWNKMASVRKVLADCRQNPPIKRKKYERRKNRIYG